MEITKLLADEAILSEIGHRIAQRRLDLRLTQAAVAEQAGIAKRTLERIEAGASAQFSSLIRIFRVLDLTSGLNDLIPETGPRPMDLLKRKGKNRQRARSIPSSKRSGQAWKWEDGQ